MKSHSNCTGCFACQAVCNHNAIRILKDNEGFSYPQINDELCVKCGLCSRICDKADKFNSCQQILCVQNKNNRLLSNATSGGVISALAEEIVRNGGAVIGASYDNVTNGAKWVAVEDYESLSSIQGSKYFQIPLDENVYKLVRNKLKIKNVLFIGTPCQVAAMVKFAGCDNLLTVDLVCGGVASPLLEEKYFDYLSKNKDEKIEKHLFRKKISGWSHEYCSEIVYQSKKVIHYKGFEDLFNYAYNSGNCMRESCYNCSYTKTERVGDFTVGDAWGIMAGDVKEFDVNKGTSLVLVNSNKAQNFIKKLDNLYIHQGDEKLLKSNKPLYIRMKRRMVRNTSYLILKKISFKVAVYIINYRHTLKKIIKGE